MIYLCINYNLLQNYILKQMKLYIQLIYNYVQARKTIYKNSKNYLQHFKCLVEWC